ncbi:MAG: ABC transporter permease [Nitrospirae bacterium]|nr:ABC transporter permease [Nitrospirota bacterium]
MYHLNHHRLLTLGAILTSAFIWVILGFFVIVYFNLFQLYSGLREDLKVLVYLKDGLSQMDVKNLEERLFSEREVLTVRFIPKEKALADFKREMTTKGDLFKNLDGNPLPSFFEIKLKESYQSSEDFSRFVNKIKGNPGVEEIFYGKEWIDVLNRYVEFIQIMGIAVGFILIVGVISMVGIIVRLTVYSKREEILVLKYIGATHLFIKIPLLMEGAFLGFMSAALSLIALYGIFYFLTHFPPFFDLLMGAPTKSTFLPLEMILLFLLSGPILGVIGSFFPLQKYLKSFN